MAPARCTTTVPIIVGCSALNQAKPSRPQAPFHPTAPYADPHEPAVRRSMVESRAGYGDRYREAPLDPATTATTQEALTMTQNPWHRFSTMIAIGAVLTGCSSYMSTNPQNSGDTKIQEIGRASCRER